MALVVDPDVTVALIFAIAYGTSAAKQTELLSTMPPIAKTVPGFDWQAWQGVVAPAATPPEIVGRLADVLQRIQTAPEFRELPSKFGMEAALPQTPAEISEMVKSDVDRYLRGQNHHPPYPPSRPQMSAMAWKRLRPVLLN